MAAGQGSIEAAAILSNWYDREQNYQEAFKWYKKLSEYGFLRETFTVGEMYQHGKGVKQNLQKALSCYQKAAEQGHIES